MKSIKNRRDCIINKTNLSEKSDAQSESDGHNGNISTIVKLIPESQTKMNYKTQSPSQMSPNIGTNIYSTVPNISDTQTKVGKSEINLITLKEKCPNIVKPTPKPRTPN